MSDMEDSPPDLEATLRAEVAEWATDSTECFHIQLGKHSFQPLWTYPIFGEEQQIFGYRDLDIHLYFTAHDLRPHIKVSWKQKFETLGEVAATDVEAVLRDFGLSETAFEEEKEKGDEDGVEEWRPPGEKLHHYGKDGKKYEIWCAPLADERARELFENMQVLVPLFIEGGTLLDLEEQNLSRWKLFLLYEVDGKAKGVEAYCLAGFGTSYRIFTFPDRKEPAQREIDLLAPSDTDMETILATLGPDAPNTQTTPLDLPSRERLSQFVILPPYQRQDHGKALYDLMYRHLITPTNVREFTVEDPSEQFDDLRDLCDLLMLRACNSQFAALHINTAMTDDDLKKMEAIPTASIVPESVREKIRVQTKIDRRQFDRLVEMHTLSAIPATHRSRARLTRKLKATNEHDRAYYLWRLYVKARLYVFNRDQLSQVEREERIERLEGAVDGVQEKYVEQIERLGEREKEMAGSGGQAVNGAERGKRKRKVVEEDEEDAEDGDEEVGGGKKKVRVS